MHHPLLANLTKPGKDGRGTTPIPGTALFALLLLACTGPDDSAAASTAPSLRLVSPEDGAVVCGSPLVVVTELENFRLTNETIEDPPPDLGHLHLYLNGQEVAQAEAETIEVSDVADNAYQLSVDIAHADHSAVEPYVGATIYVTVAASACSS